MKKLYYYIQFEFRNLYKKVMLLILTMCITQNLIFAIITSTKSMYQDIDQYIRFEDIISNLFYMFMFYLVFALTLCSIAITVSKDYSGTKSIYSLLTIPVPRKIIYFSKLISGLMSLLMIYLGQLISIFITYGLYKMIVPVENQITHGFALAVLRNPFLAVFIPVNPIAIIFNIITLAYIVIIIVFAVTAIKSKSYKLNLNIAVVFCSIVLAFTAILTGNNAGFSSFLIPISPSELAQMTFQETRGFLLYAMSIIEILIVSISCIIGGLRIYEKADIL